MLRDGGGVVSCGVWMVVGVVVCVVCCVRRVQLIVRLISCLEGIKVLG